MDKNTQIARLIQAFYMIESNKAELQRYKDSTLNDKIKLIQRKLDESHVIPLETLISEYRGRTNELIEIFNKIL